MKKYLFALTALVLVSCNQTPEQKAEDLIKPEICQNLFKPDTYELVDIKVDSAFAPLDSREFYDMMDSLLNCFAAIHDLAKNAANNNGDIDMPLYNKMRKDLLQGMHAFDDSMKAEKRFIGYKVYHKYHTENIENELRFYKDYFYVDKDIENIIFKLNFSSHEYYSEFIDTMKVSIEDLKSQGRF